MKDGYYILCPFDNSWLFTQGIFSDGEEYGFDFSIGQAACFAESEALDWLSRLTAENGSEYHIIKIVSVKVSSVILGDKK